MIMLKKYGKFILTNTALMALLLALMLYAVLAVFRPNAATLSSVSIMLATASMLLFPCVGQMVVITSGDGIDLSVGAVMSTTAVITVEMMRGRKEMIVPSLIVCIIVGIFIGLINGIGTAYIKIPALIMTLCISNILGRVQLVISRGAPRGQVADIVTKSLTVKYSVTTLLTNFLPGITVWAALFFGVSVLFLKCTRYGYRLKFVGTNFQAAHLSGMRAKQIRMIAYAICGMLSGLGGFVGAGYYRQMQTATFDHYTMQSISAVVIGGTLLAGGKPDFAGTVFGAVLLTILSQFLSAFNTSIAVRNIIMGLMLIILLIAYNRKPKIRQ